MRISPPHIIGAAALPVVQNLREHGWHLVHVERQEGEEGGVPDTSRFERIRVEVYGGQVYTSHRTIHKRVLEYARDPEGLLDYTRRHMLIDLALTIGQEKGWIQ